MRRDSSLVGRYECGIRAVRAVWSKRMCVSAEYICAEGDRGINGCVRILHPSDCLDVDGGDWYTSSKNYARMRGIGSA